MTSTTDIAPASPESNAPRASNYSSIEILGTKLPVHPWAVTFFTCIMILSTVVSVSAKFVFPFLSQRLESFRSDKAKASLPYTEYQKHFREQPTKEEVMFDNPEAGNLTVAYYPSDGCLLVKRIAPGSTQAKWDWIPRSATQDEPAPGKVASASGSQRPDSSTDHQPAVPEYQLTALSVGAAAAEPQGCSGKCWDPHPGPFQSWNGQQNGCWIQVWRKWPEGCQHYQWYNSCNGYWDSYPNGAPKVYWTCCMH